MLYTIGIMRNEPIENKKTLYEKIAQGQMDSLSLQLIKKEVDELIQGNKEFERYEGENGYISGTEPRLSEGMRRAGEIHAAAALICRADESAGRQYPSGSDEGRRSPLAHWTARQRHDGKRQEELLQKYAEATDCWYQVDNLDDSLIIGVGGESVVYRYDEENVLKVNTLRHTISPQILLDRITIHNYMFPDTAMDVLGFAKNEFGEFCIIYTQPFVEGTKPTRQQIEEHIGQIGRGVDRYILDGTNYKNDYILFDDLHKENVILDTKGNLRVIDSDLKFNTPELGLGGKFIIPPATDDLKLKKDRSEKRKHDSNMNNTSNHIELTGILHSCVTSPCFSQIPGTIAAKMEICTASIKMIDGIAKYVDPMKHRVMVTASGETAEKLKALEKECMNCDQDNRMNPDNPLKYASAVSITGHLRMDQKNEAYVFAEEISFPENLTMKNHMSLSGKITKATVNSSYASVDVKTSEPIENKTIKIPLTVFKSNLDAFNQFETGRIGKGHEINVDGKLISMYFNSGENKIWRCSVNASTVSKIKKEQKHEVHRSM